MTNPAQQEHDLTLHAQFLDMVQTQHATNVVFAGKDWVQRATVIGQQLDAAANRMPLDYATASIGELAELFKSAVPYEWWRDASRHKVDAANCRIELVDIFHFLMGNSIPLAVLHAPTWNHDCLKADLKHDPIPTSAMESAFKMSADVMLQTYNWAWQHHTEALAATSQDIASGKPALTETERLVALRRQLRKLHQALGEWDGSMDYIESAWLGVWDTVFALARYIQVIGLPQLLICTFHAKAALNAFRQFKGDKQGTYARVWDDGREDNVHVQLVLEHAVNDGRAPSRADILEWLEVNYPVQAEKHIAALSSN